MDPPAPAPIPQANSEGYNKVKLRYMSKLNFDKQQLAQRTLAAEKTLMNRDSRASSFPVSIPSSSPQAITNIPVDIPNKDSNSRKTRNTIQLTTLGHKRFEEEDDFDLKNNAATFVPPHLISSNETSFSVQRFHDRKRLARMAF